MRRSILCFLLLSFAISVFAQETFEGNNKYPVFQECESVDINTLADCFNETLVDTVISSFEVPTVVTEENYVGKIVVLFEVTEEGVFKVLYVDAVYDELKEEAKRVFGTFPKVKPATSNGRPTYTQFTLPITIPLDQNIRVSDIPEEPQGIDEEKIKGEYDAVNKALVPYENIEYTSQLNVPLSHSRYGLFDAQINKVGTNSHTASKPFLFSDVNNYYDFEIENQKLAKAKSTWWGRKLWNEHMVTVQGKDYWFTLDPIADLQLGKDSDSDIDYTYNNTRGLLVQGGLGKNFNFSASVYESQGRFADYFNQYAESIAPSGGNPAIIPGRGIAKRFKDDAYDYPVAEAYLSYTPSKFFNIQFGHGKNFIGDGYRSLFLSDVASPHPFLKLNTKFWKIKYTNTWMWLRDVRPEVTEDGAFLTKYMANHYLSWNVTKRLNLGFFESVIWSDDNNRGFDFNYLNPIIFYRAIEFSTGSRAGNAIVGFSGKYKWSDSVNLYGQFILDEFSLDDIKAGNQSWKNKFGFQIGAKYYNAFNVEGLMLQAEYNQVRPYTYSHNTIVLNYGHNNQSMAHLWGANFREFVGIARYNKGRWFGNAKLIFGKRGFDFEDGVDNFNYGGNIYRSEDDRPGDTGIEIGQGNKTNVIIADLQAGYLINPSTNLKLFGNITYRNFDPNTDTAKDFKQNTTWFNIGLRTDIFNWYNDF